MKSKYISPLQDNRSFPRTLESGFFFFHGNTNNSEGWTDLLWFRLTWCYIGAFCETKYFFAMWTIINFFQVGCKTFSGETRLAHCGKNINRKIRMMSWRLFQSIFCFLTWGEKITSINNKWYEIFCSWVSHLLFSKCISAAVTIFWRAWWWAKMNSITNKWGTSNYLNDNLKNHLFVSPQMYSLSKCLAIPFGIPLRNNLWFDKPESFCGYYQKPGTTRSWCVNTCRVWPCRMTMNRDGEHNTKKQFESS